MNIEISPVEYERKLNWYDGKLYCDLLVIDGKDDWRMPTKEELNDIYNSENDLNNPHWSSTEFNGKHAWFQNLSFGYQASYTNKIDSYYVRPVRNI